MLNAIILFALLACFVEGSKPKHILVIVADDLGHNDLGARNTHGSGPRTITPTIDGLIASGLTLSSYHTFKICSPSRASTLTGRYPWGAGFYDMNTDNDHTTTNFTLYPTLLQQAGYKTYGLGKWDVGFMVRNATATVGRGFDSFYGYYLACNADYWYHTVANGGSDCDKGAYNSSVQDWSDNVGESLGPGDRVGRNGTYNRNLLSGRAASIIASHDTAQPLFMYLAFQNAHEGCARPDKLGLQAPLAAVDLYNNTILDTYKLMGAMLTELDYGVKEVVDALHASGLYNDTLIWFVSDNGGPLEHSTNAPRRGGKHTFWDGGLRVEAFLAGGGLPPTLAGTTWPGLAHASDTYLTLVEGYAGVAVDPTATCGVPGCRPLDGYNLWPAILASGPSLRTEIVHQVNNSYFDEGVQAIRVGDLKVIRGQAGDNRTIAWPERSVKPVPLGQSGAVVEPGTDHVRSTVLGGSKLHMCRPYCLFNITADEGENFDLGKDPAYAQVAAAMLQRLDFHGATGPPHAYIWNVSDFQKQVQKGCPRQVQTGSVQPVDI